MLDSFLRLTIHRALWIAVFFVIALALHAGVSALTGVQEPMFLLAAVLLPAYLVVSTAYTLVMRVLRR